MPTKRFSKRRRLNAQRRQLERPKPTNEAGNQLKQEILAFAFIALVLIFSIRGTPIVARADVSDVDAKSLIDQAQMNLIACYQAVEDASKAGANVVGLIPVLNQAGETLSRADAAYSNGDFGSAQGYANQTLNLLNQNDVKAHADVLKTQASQAQFHDFIVNVVAPLAGAAVVILVGCAVWLALKKRNAQLGGTEVA